MILSSACRKTGEPDATRTAQVLRLNPSLKQKKKKRELCTLRPDLKKIYMYLYVYQTSVCPRGGRLYILQKVTAVGLKY